MPIQREANQRRSAHRVSLPMALELGGRTYEVLDWSVTGLAARIPPEVSLRPGEAHDARLHIPMPGARIALDVRLRVVARRSADRVAFTFVDLSARNRRILRHYIELGVEGRLGDLEDMVSLLAQPDLPSPVRDAMVLSDLEEETLARSFRRRAVVSVTVGVGFLLFVAAVLFYNTVYRVEGAGVALGQVRRVEALATSVLRTVTVAPGQRVTAGATLFTLDRREVEIELARVERELALVRARFVAGGAATVGAVDAGEGAAAAVRPVAARTGGGKTGLFPVPVLPGPGSAGRDSGAAPARAGDELAGLLIRRTRLEAERRRLLARLERHVGRAPVAGRVFRVAAEPGDRVRAGQTVVLLEVDRPPVIVARVRGYEARKLRPGMEALVSSAVAPAFRARIVRVGYAAVDPDFSATEEASLDEVLVTLEPLDSTVRLPPFTRVDVWIRTFAPFGP